jgi:hypothetical protein
MPKEVLIALVAAGASFLVATVGLTSALLAGRAQRRVLREVEQIKGRLQASSEARRVVDAQLAQSFESLKNSMKSIQLMKDEIRLVARATPATLSRAESKKRLDKAQALLFETYQIHHPDLEPAEAGAFHRAKNQVQDGVRKFLEDQDTAGLLTAREALQEAQDTLRDGLTRRLLDRAAAAASEV